MTPDKRKAETAPSITIRQKKRFRFLWLAAPVLIGLLLTTRSAWPDNHLFASLIQQFGAIYVFAFIAGLGGMTLAAFNDRYEFFLIDDIDPQRLNNAARNYEIAAWKLSNDKAPDGVVLILSNDSGPPANLSFEREFGRMIGNLDLLSAIISDKTNRTVVKVVQTMATAVFLPVAGIR